MMDVTDINIRYTCNSGPWGTSHDMVFFRYNVRDRTNCCLLVK